MFAALRARVANAVNAANPALGLDDIAGLQAAGEGAALELAPVVLTFINQRSDGSALRLVLFKPNATVSGAADPAGAPLAWKVVRCAPKQQSRATYPFSQQLAVFAPDGPHGSMQEARAGQRFYIDRSGVLQRDTSLAAAPVAANTVPVHNATQAQRLDVLLYKDGRPLCRSSGLAPGESTLFDVLPTLYMAIDSAPHSAGGRTGATLSSAVHDIAEGGTVDAVSAASATPIILLGLKSADIIVSGTASNSSLRVVNQRFS